MVPAEPSVDARALNTVYLLPVIRQFRDTSHRCVQTMCRMDLFAKAKDLGIQTEFVDGQGHRHVTAAAALKIILDALPSQAPDRFSIRRWCSGPDSPCKPKSSDCQASVALENRCGS